MNDLLWIDELVNRHGFWRPEHGPWRSERLEDVQEIERMLGGALPVEYIYFLNKYGGGSLGNDDFQVAVPVFDSSPWGKSTSPECFAPLFPSHPDSLKNEIAAFEGRIPRGVAPISRDAGGNQICLERISKTTSASGRSSITF